MSYPKIGIDMDGVVSNYVESYSRRLVQTSGSNLFEYDRQEKPIWTDWNMDLLVGYTKEQTTHARKSIAQDSFFWLQLSPYAGVEEAFAKLIFLTDNLYFITDRSGDSAKVQTELWLDKLHIPNPTVLITSKKGLATEVLGLDYYVDDKPENCQDAALHGAFAFLLNRPWNDRYDIQSSRIARVDHLSVAINLIKLMESQREEV